MGNNQTTDQTTQILRPLFPKLPEMPEKPAIDEDGEEFCRGFNGDVSQSALYVTDGHILFLASAIDPAISIGRDEDSFGRKYATEEKIEAIWKPAEARDELIADFIGTNRDEDGDGHCVAFLRDGAGRMPIVNAYLLAFGLYVVRPDVLTVGAAPIEGRWFNTAIGLRREGRLVGLLMPMKLSADDFPGLDFHGAAINISER